MKSLSLSRPLVITVIGLPGAGKSFFARQFADMFGAPLVSHDVIRHTLFEQAQYSTEEDALVHAIVDQQIVELLKTGKTIIVDGGMNTRQARFALERQARLRDYGRLIVWVQTDEPTSRNRSLRRSDKRKGDEFNSPMEPGAFDRYRKHFGAPQPSEGALVISGKHTFATQAKVVLRKLVSPHEATAPLRTPEPKAENPEVKPSVTHDIQPRRRGVTIN